MNMNPKDEQALREIVTKLKTAWNNADSVGWASLFAEDADFIHILGVHYTGRPAIEAGHRVIWDTIYKGSKNKLVVEKIRPVGSEVAVVFLEGELTFYDNGVERHIKARPTLVAQKMGDSWQIAAFQNTLVAEAMTAGDKDRLVQQHPFKAADSAAGGR
jgi:uncharacterized protein (TIGR02246 family)